MPLLRRVAVLAAKVEGTVGTAETLTASEAAFNVFNPQLNPTIDFQNREGQGAFSPITGVPAARGGSCSFELEFTGRTGSSGGSVPAWASTFLPACGFVDDGTGLFQLKSEGPGTTTSNPRTLTIGRYVNGVRKILRGCMGNVVMTFPTGRKAMLRFTFTGVWVAQTDATILAPTYPTATPKRFANTGALSLGGTAIKPESISIDLGNQVILREDANQEAGYCNAIVTGRNITGTMNPEAELVATEDPYGDWLARTEKALNIQLGTGVGKIDIDLPKTQATNVQEGDRGGLLTDEITFIANRNASAGNDDLTIDFN